jgi:hypothetical protein
MTELESVGSASGKAGSKSLMSSGFMKESKAKRSESSISVRPHIQVRNQKPLFKGGDINEFVVYLQNQLFNSGLTPNRTDTDSVFISFVVDTLGRPADIRLINRIDQETEKQIIRQINASPDWHPGTKNGFRINVGYTISLQIPADRAE